MYIYICPYAQNINPFGATKKFRCLDSSFHYLVEAFYLLSSPTWAAYFSHQFCGPLLPPAQECNSLQRISFTHHHSQYLPPFLLIYPLGNLPILKDSVSKCPHLKLEYPSTYTARSFWTTSKRTQEAVRFCLLQQYPLPTEFGLLLLFSHGMPTSE